MGREEMPTGEDLLGLATQTYSDAEDWEKNMWFWFVNEALPMVCPMWRSMKDRVTKKMNDVCDSSDEWLIIYSIEMKGRVWQDEYRKKVRDSDKHQKGERKTNDDNDIDDDGSTFGRKNVVFITEEGKARMGELDDLMENRRSLSCFEEWVVAVQSYNAKKWETNHPKKAPKVTAPKTKPRSIPNKL